jgi:hypothetical protein
MRLLCNWPYSPKSARREVKNVLLLLLLRMLLFVFLLAMFVPLINTVLLLGAPVLSTWWVKMLTYLQSEPFLSIIFHNFLPKIANNIYS